LKEVGCSGAAKRDPKRKEATMAGFKMVPGETFTVSLSGGAVSRSWTFKEIKGDSAVFEVGSTVKDGRPLTYEVPMHGENRIGDLPKTVSAHGEGIEVEFGRALGLYVEFKSERFSL